MGADRETTDRRSRDCNTTYVVWLCGLWSSAPKVVYRTIVWQVEIPFKNLWVQNM